MLLALDIGGTKVTLATFARSEGGLVLGAVSRYETKAFKDLPTLLAEHLHSLPGARPALRGVGIGVAGPVFGRRVQLTNLPWSIDADALERQLGAPVFLLNDLEAHACSIAAATPADHVVIQTGTPRPGNRALIAAGTGLGEAMIILHRGKWIASASEGGHASFAPPTSEDVELLQFLQQRYTHVSWERVVSGLDGFRNLVEFLSATGRITLSSALQSPKGAGRDDLGAQVVSAANQGEAWARTVIAWFVRLYAAEAGNLALKTMAVGGLFIGGGIAPRLLPWLQTPDFRQAFAAKGRFEGLLTAMPVSVIIDGNSALKGAAAYAAAQLAES